MSIISPPRLRSLSPAIRLQPLATSLALVALAAMPDSASAHASLQTQTAQVGASYRGVMRIPHGCDGAPTLKVRMLIPEGVIAVKPMPKPGWTIEIVRGPYAKSYKYYHGAVLTEGPKELIWTGKLLDEHYDEFVFSAVISDTLVAGTRIHFPLHQECEGRAVAWTEVPGPGQSARELKSPAPALTLVAAPGPATYKLGSLVVEAPWTRATPGGARVAAGYLKITNNGDQSDRLVGGSLAAAADVEVHEMALVDSMMKMRHLPMGVEIKPGGTVELKPGSYHLMFLGLSAPLAEGQMHKGTLRFEKAGSVEVSFQVAPIGARSAGSESHH